MKKCLIDLTGQRFGKLIVIKRHENSYLNGMSRWECQCDCGGVTIVGSHHLRSTKKPTLSCGCLKLTARRTHGHMSKPKTHGFCTNGRASRTYNSWRSMRERCLSPNSCHYKDYGGRGITVCDRWNDKTGFINFLTDMGERPENTTLDRINVNGNYGPENCRWATSKQQRINKRKCVAIENFTDEEIIKEFNRRFNHGKQEWNSHKEKP